jgi:hypothetical protein
MFLLMTLFDVTALAAELTHEPEPRGDLRVLVWSTWSGDADPLETRFWGQALDRHRWETTRAARRGQPPPAPPVLTEELIAELGVVFPFPMEVEVTGPVVGGCSTDDHGICVVRGLPPGTYQVSVRYNTCGEATESVQVTDGQEVSVPLALHCQPSCSLEVRSDGRLRAAGRR